MILFKPTRFNYLKIILLLALLQLAVTLLTDGFALSFDESMWHYIGRNWFRHGLVPYTGGVDNKSPLIFAIFGLSDTFFGVNYWFPRVLGTVCQTISILYIYKIAKHIAGEQAGVLAISFYGLSLLWHGTGGRYVAFTETYAILFIVLAFYHYIIAHTPRNIFLSGLFAGIGLCFRLTASFAIAALYVDLFKNNKRNSLYFCSGLILSVASFLLAAYVAGINIHQLFTYTLADNFGAGSTTDHSLLWKFENLSDKFFYSEIILFYPFLLGYIFIKRKADIFVLWLILAFTGINIIGVYGTVHLRELLPTLSLMSAFAVMHLVNNYKVPVKPLLVIIWITFFPKLLEPLVTLKKLITGKLVTAEKYGEQPYIKPNEGARKQLGWWIKANTNPNDKVYVAGFGAQVQVYAERTSPTVYFNATQTRIAKQTLYAQLQCTKPVMILVPLFAEYDEKISADMRLFLDKLIAGNYYLERSLYNYNVYRLKK